MGDAQPGEILHEAVAARKAGAVRVLDHIRSEKVIERGRVAGAQEIVGGRVEGVDGGDRLGGRRGGHGGHVRRHDEGGEDKQRHAGGKREQGRHRQKRGSGRDQPWASADLLQGQLVLGAPDGRHGVEVRNHGVDLLRVCQVATVPLWRIQVLPSRG